MDVQVFKPTYDNFKNFMQYIQYMESLEAHKSGVAKIIAPVEWSAFLRNQPKVEGTIPVPLYQSRKKISDGVYFQTCIKREPMTIESYKKHAGENQHDLLKTANNDIENIFWENVCSYNPYYLADVPGSLFHKTTQGWNLSKVPCMLSDRKEIMKFQGILSPYLYYGAAYTAFCFHKEDMDLYSINYQHAGAPKFWYVILPQESAKFEKLVNTLYGEYSGECKAHIRHKQILISPKILAENDIHFTKVIQNPGEIVVTFPLAYHGGFNSGFNCNEAVNFATPRWLNYAKRTDWCTCKPRVLFSIDGLIKKYQYNETYKKYVKKEDCTPHPEYPWIRSACEPLTKKFVNDYYNQWSSD